jgi:tRNA-Thr(GGU) m(6)t(6)A37 methyltransferase TsaA
MNFIQFQPIGIIRTQYSELSTVPIQPVFATKSMLSVAIVDEIYTQGLRDLDGFSHVMLVYHFHRAKAAKMLQKPFLDDVLRGVFAIRSPHRPNPIGVSVVEIVKVEENRIYFNSADMLDETPLLDIKPFVAAFDCRQDTKNGWLKDVISHTN